NENDNSAVRAVIECFEDIARSGNCAISLWHHTRKQGNDASTIESARGGMAFVDACRAVRILEVMTKKDREELTKAVPDMKEHGYYFRSWVGKRNFAPPSDQSDWHKLESIKLKNYTFDFEDDGDYIGVATPWHYPKIEKPIINEADAERILKAISKGP